jgi:hypothetical protein
MQAVTLEGRHSWDFHMGQNIHKHEGKRPSHRQNAPGTLSGSMLWGPEVDRPMSAEEVKESVWLYIHSDLLPN